jgi:hypothetical protein
MDWITSLAAGEGARIVGLALALLAGSAGAKAPGPAAQLESEAAPGCAWVAPEIGAEPWLRTELFFGLSKPDGAAVSEAEWNAFLDIEVTPRFPDGLTVLAGAGQWQDDDGDIVEERSKVLVLLYPREASAESNAEIEAIRTAYESAFQQESVLRADDDRPVCTSF